MCRVEDCERHEFDHGYCLPHLKAVRALEKPAKAPEKPVKAPRKAAQPKAGTSTHRKKIDAVEVEIRDGEEVADDTDTE